MTRLLTADEELMLARRIERGDLEAKEQLIASNLRLVRALAARYRGHGVPFEDLVQEGTIGLVRAAERFDHRRELRFSTYATWWIRRSLLDALGTARAIRIPPGARQRLAAIHRAHDELRVAGHVPTTGAIAQRTGLGEPMIRALRGAPHVSASLDQPVGEDDTPLGELLLGDDGSGVTRRLEDDDARRTVWALLRLLPARHREVLLRRYGLGEDGPQSHEQIAAWLGVGEERSRQLERQALHWLRELAA